MTLHIIIKKMKGVLTNMKNPENIPSIHNPYVASFRVKHPASDLFCQDHNDINTWWLFFFKQRLDCGVL